MYKKSLLYLLILLTDAFSSWKTLEKGLEIGSFQSPDFPDTISAIITILRINPDLFSLQLHCASASGNDSLHSAKQWCEKENLVAAINASMYQEDYKTSVSLMKTAGHTNNSFLSKDKTILAFDPKDNSLPHFRLIDRQCDDFNLWKLKYTSFVQSIRMISCTGKNVWEKGRCWSISALGTDRRGRILFIFTPAPHSVHQLSNVLMRLPLDIDRAMYLEGGYIAQMAINTGTFTMELSGQLTGTGYSPAMAPEIPNVLGIVRKK